MITTVCALLLAVAPTPPEALRGIDDLPPREAIELSATSLWSLVDDERVDLVMRARSLRLLPQAVAKDDRAVAQTRLKALWSSWSTPAALAYDAAVAHFELAARTSATSARAVATAAERATQPAVRQAAALMWWRVGGEVGRAALQRCATTETVVGVRATCIGRLRAPVSTPVTGAVSDVLHETSDGDPPTSPGRQLRHPTQLPQQR